MSFLVESFLLFSGETKYFILDVKEFDHDGTDLSSSSGRTAVVVEEVFTIQKR